MAEISAQFLVWPLELGHGEAVNVRALWSLRLSTGPKAAAYEAERVFAALVHSDAERQGWNTVVSGVGKATW